MADWIGVDVTKSTGFYERTRARDARVVQMLRDGVSYDDICGATGIHRTRISLLAKQAGLLQRDVRTACSVDDCENTENAHGLCQMHNQRLKKYGSLDLPPAADPVTKWRRDNSERLAEHTKNYRARNPEKRRAHRKVEVEIRTGRMAKQPCSECGNEKSQAHHDDYTKPLDVIWLCALHHKRRHVMLKEQGRDPDLTVPA